MSWRVWRYLELGGVLSAACRVVAGAMQAVEVLPSFVEFTQELCSGGDLEVFARYLGAAIVICGLWVYRGRSGAQGDSDGSEA